MRIVHFLSVLLLVWLGGGAFARVQDARSSSPTLEAARVRWEALSSAEQQRLKSRYARWCGLSEDERRELIRRASVLRETRERVEGALQPEQRERLEQLEPAKRRELIQELVENEVREKGERVRAKMPEEWLRRLEAARPQDRARF